MSATNRSIGSDGLEQGGMDLGNDISRKDLSVKNAGDALTNKPVMSDDNTDNLEDDELDDDTLLADDELDVVEEDVVVEDDTILDDDDLLLEDDDELDDEDDKNI